MGSLIGLTADDFTFARVEQAAHAYAQQVQGTVLVGFDTRFLSDRFAARVAGVLLGVGLEVQVSRTALPFSALRFALQHLGAQGGVYLGAGSLGAQHNGLEFLDAAGQSVEVIPTDGVAHLAQTTPATFDIRKPYYDHLASQLNLEALGAYPGPLYHEGLGGAGSGWIAGFCKHAGLPFEVRELHAVPHPSFYGLTPDLSPNSLRTLLTLLKVEDEGVWGLATNGDASQVALARGGGRLLEPAEWATIASGDALLDGLRALQTVVSQGKGER